MENKRPSKPKSSWLRKSYWWFAKAESVLGHFLLLFVRLYWGFLLISAGLGKWMYIQGVIDYFSQLRIVYPQVSAYAIATVELLGGISLMLGFLTRYFSLLLSVSFFIAYATAHSEAIVRFIENPSLFVQQEPFLFLLAALMVLCFGPGIFSIDYWIEKKVYHTSIN